jgi:hypothetical protein
MRIPRWIVVAFLLLSDAALAEPESDRTTRMVRTQVAPRIDGRLDEPAWQTAPADARFVQNFPLPNQPPSEVTELRLLYDDRALYVGIRAHDTNPSAIVERLTRRDRDNDADQIMIGIDSRFDRVSAYHFGVNVSGVLVDALRFNDTDFSTDWDGVWNAAVSRDQGGYAVEMEIPWSSLRFEGSSPVLGLQVRRFLARNKETDEWVHIPRTAGAEVSRYGRLVGATGLGPTRLVQISPYVAARSTLGHGAGPDQDLELVPNGGVDLKVGLSSSLTLDATVNPDFGQVEADQVQLNLTTLELFFPEKRPFFLEGIELFAQPLQQFYTRRIGRTPPAVRLVEGETLESAADAGRIFVASKVTGQLNRRFSIAAIDALTSAQEASVRKADGSVAEREVEPLANYGIVRVRGESGNSSVGLTATAVNRFEAAPTERNCKEGIETRERCTRDAYALGADARLFTRDGAWGLHLQGIVSHLEHGPARTLPDGTVVVSGDSGVAYQVSGGKFGGDLFTFGARYVAFSPAFEINDVGFNPQANIQRVGGVFTLRSTRPLGPTLERSLEMFSGNRLTFAGVRLSSSVGGAMSTQLANFWTLRAGGGYTLEGLENRETRDGALVERPAYWFWDAKVETDSRRRVKAELSVEGATREAGAYHFGQATLFFKLFSQLELDVTPRVTQSYGDYRFYTKEAQPGGASVYRFAALEATSYDLTLRGTYTFTPRLTLQAYAQLFVAAKHYSDFRSILAVGERPRLRVSAFQREMCAHPTSGVCEPTEDDREGSINANVVLRWEYRPSSALMAVYTRQETQAAYDPKEGIGASSLSAFGSGSAVDQLLVKLTYLW